MFLISTVATAVFVGVIHHHRLHPGSLTPENTARHLQIRSPASLNKPAPPTVSNSLACQNLYELVCAQTGITTDPTGVVRPDTLAEKLAYAEYESIISQNPDWESDRVDDELVSRLYTDSRRSRLIDAFAWARRGLEKFIDSQPENVFTLIERKQLKSRLRKVQLQLPPPATIYADEPDLLTKSGAYFERMTDGSTKIRVGGAYFLGGESWFNLISTLAHELSHSIDPCELKSTGINPPAYARLAHCFVRTGLVASAEGRNECGHNDQLSEAFADWMAAQVSAEALKNFSIEFDQKQLAKALVNSVRDLCETPDAITEIDTVLHPSPRVRITAIFGRNSAIQELIGCPNNPEEKLYCDFNP